jgi:hypothetical protein
MGREQANRVSTAASLPDLLWDEGAERGLSCDTGAKKFGADKCGRGPRDGLVADSFGKSLNNPRCLGALEVFMMACNSISTISLFLKHAAKKTGILPLLLSANSYK